jgi:hypothetical protein
MIKKIDLFFIPNKRWILRHRIMGCKNNKAKIRRDRKWFKGLQWGYFHKNNSTSCIDPINSVIILA